MMAAMTSQSETGRYARNGGALIRALCLALLLTSAAACITGSGGSNAALATGRTDAPSPRGHLLIVGGGPSPTEITQRFLDLAGGKGRARIVVFPMASAVASTGPEKVKDLISMGAHAFVLDVQGAGANTDSAVRLLDDVTGIWFSGGDQNRLAAALRGSRLERAIHARYAAGAVVGGTSAGAAVMTNPMFTGDERRPGGSRIIADSTQANITIDRNNVVTAPGFGLLPGAIVDQHFVRRRRQNRLLSLVLENPSLLGIGIDESTALVVRPGGSWEIIGASVAVVLDARSSEVTPAGTVLGASGVRMHVLPAGSTFDPSTGRVTRLGMPRK